MRRRTRSRPPRTRRRFGHEARKTTPRLWRTGRHRVEKAVRSWVRKQSGLTQSFGKRNRACERDIERASAAAQRDDNAGRRGAMHLLGHPGALPAKEDRVVSCKDELMQL